MIGDIQEFYSECLEDWPMASDDIRNTYSQMHTVFDEYIAAVQLQAFSYGYEQGMKAVGKVIKN